MTRLRVSIAVDAPPSRVWADLERIESHVEWMRDAVAIEFTSDRHRGVGTTFDCRTKVGPFKLTDRMEITEWSPDKAMGVRHVGLVTGEGVISLRPIRLGRHRHGTRVSWSEGLTFPWWMGGPVGAIVATPILWLVWRGSMRNLRARFPGGR